MCGRSFHRMFLCSIFLCFSGPLLAESASPRSPGVSAEEILSRCAIKNNGEDQRSQMTVILQDSLGTQRKSVYKRLWKSYAGKKGVAEKMVLFTEFPPDARGTAFMRWAYTPGSSKREQQWVYLPVLRKMKRVSISDLNRSFLGTDLNIGDISPRPLEQDEHKVLKVEYGLNNDFILIESVPKEGSSLYSRKIQWFVLTNTWDNCVQTRTDYFDRRGDLLKQQQIQWQKIAGAWIWHKVLVQNVQTNHSSHFIIENVQMNTGIRDRTFSERTLRLVQK